MGCFTELLSQEISVSKVSFTFVHFSPLCVEHIFQEKLVCVQSLKREPPSSGVLGLWGISLLFIFSDEFKSPNLNFTVPGNRHTAVKVFFWRHPCEVFKGFIIIVSASVMVYLLSQPFHRTVLDLPWATKQQRLRDSTVCKAPFLNSLQYLCRGVPTPAKWLKTQTQSLIWYKNLLYVCFIVLSKLLKVGKLQWGPTRAQKLRKQQ